MVIKMTITLMITNGNDNTKNTNNNNKNIYQGFTGSVHYVNKPEQLLFDRLSLPLIVNLTFVP